MKNYKIEIFFLLVAVGIIWIVFSQRPQAPGAQPTPLPTPTIIYLVEFAPGGRRITATANTENLAEITPELDRKVWREMAKKYRSWGQTWDAKECEKLARMGRKNKK